MVALAANADRFGASRDGEASRPVYGNLKFIRGLFSLSENGFRLYERAGLVHPGRNEENGYRVASLSDGVLLCNAFNLTHLGFSLNDASRLLSSATIDDQLLAFEDLDAELGEQIEKMSRQRKHLEHRIRLLTEYIGNPRRCRMPNDREMLFVPLHRQDMSGIEGTYEDCVVWWQASPMVDAGLVVFLDERLRCTEVLHGPVASAKTAALMGLPTERAMRFNSDNRPCIHAYVSFPAEEMPDETVYAHIWDYLSDNGLEFTGGQILHRLLRHQFVDGVAMRHDEVFVPVTNCVM